MSDINKGDNRDLIGADELVDAIEQLPRALQNKVLYQANLDILRTVIRDPLKAALPYSSKSKKGIGVRKAKGTQTGVYAGVMSVAFWLRFLEFGTAPRKGRRRRGAKESDKGSINPRPFIAPFITSRDDEVLEEVTQRYDSFVTESLKRNLNRTNTKIGKL